MESNRPVHDPWEYINIDNDVMCEPDEADSYMGPAGGPSAGPSSKMDDFAKASNLLIGIFMAIIPLAFFVKVENMTHIYCYKYWVVKKFGQGRDGDWNRKKYFSGIPPKKNDVNYPERRHRADNEKNRFNITPRYVICWIGILILQGAHFGSHKKVGSKLWRQGPYGVNIPYIQNSMTGNAFEFMRRFIHFTDNSIRKVS